jgi:serine/threonine protein phosphatase PrpC
MPGYAMLQLETAGLSDIGKKRDHQEDAFLVDDEHRLYVVADGMGGHLAGEVASAIVIETLQAAVNDSNSPPATDPDTSLSPEGTMLASWIQNANRRVFEQSQSQEQCRGMGSTIAALYYTGQRVMVANVGDSPIYLVRAGSIELISAIHTMAADQAARDLYGEDTLLKQFNHMLTRAVGTDNDVQPYIRELSCCANDSYIICSDGLSNAIEPEEMLATVQQCTAGKACRELITMANARGGDDNITVIVIKVCG